MEVKRICQWCGKPFIAKKTTTNYCSHQCASQGYKHRMRERRLELRELQDLIEVKSKLDHQDYFTFAQAAQLMGVSRQYIYKLVKEDKLRASRISARMSIIRRADIELMLKTRPYERRRVKDDLDITEYYTAEQISEKYKVSQKWIWAYTRENNIPKIRIRQFNYYSKKHIDAAFAKYKTDNDLTEWYTPEEIEQKYGMSRVAIRSHVYRNNIPLQHIYITDYQRLFILIGTTSVLTNTKNVWTNANHCISWFCIYVLYRLFSALLWNVRYQIQCIG